MAADNMKDIRSFFTKASPREWEYVMSIYKEALALKAQQKNKKPEELLKLDCWYQEELPKLIQSRKERHITHDELVQTMKWKLSRGKWRPRLTDLVKINTPLAVVNASKRAFKKLPKLAAAVQALSVLKGVGPATASAVLAAAAPELAPFMADECLLSVPDIDGIDYTVREYMRFAQKIQSTAERLNSLDINAKWTPHKVELALWAHYIVKELNPKLLESMPKPDNEDDSSTQNGKSETQSDETKSGEGEHSNANQEDKKNGQDVEEKEKDADETPQQAEVEAEKKQPDETNKRQQDDLTKTEEEPDCKRVKTE